MSVQASDGIAAPLAGASLNVPSPRMVTSLMLAGAAFSVAQAGVAPALPMMEEEFGISEAAAGWVLTSTLVSGAVLTPIIGRAGDIVGKRRMMLATLGVTAFGLALTCVTSSLELLLVGRVIQGFGGGVYPLAYATVRDQLPPERVPAAIGVIGAALGVGAAVSVVSSGIIVDHVPYRWLFLLPLVLVLIAALGCARYVPESADRAPDRLNLSAAALMGMGLVALLVAITDGPTVGWLSGRTIGLLLTAWVLLALWGVAEARATHPLIDLMTLRRRELWTTNAVTLLVGGCMFCAFIVIPQLAQQEGSGFGVSAGTSGVLLLPLIVGQIGMAALAGRVNRLLGPRAPVALGCALCVGGYLGLAVAHDNVWQLCLGGAVVGVGTGLSFTALPNLIVRAVSATQSGSATAVNSVVRVIGGALGTQIAATCLVANYGTDGLPTEGAYGLAFLSGAVAAVAALCLTGLIPAPRRDRRIHS